MNRSKIYLGDNKAYINDGKITGEIVSFENETFYKISNSNAMRPFFMSIVSDSNHWMFISSTGSLSAGRKNSEFSCLKLNLAGLLIFCVIKDNYNLALWVKYFNIFFLSASCGQHLNVGKFH